MEDFTVTIDDIRKTGHCVSGIRRWFEINHLDFRDFLVNGISAQRLLDTGDELGIDVVIKIKERLSNG